MTNLRRLMIQIGILIFFLFILSAPLSLFSLNFSFRKTTDLFFLIHRLIGLYAFSLIFLAFVMGSTISLLDRFFTPGKAFVTHRIIATLGFSLSILHPLFLFGTYMTEKNFSYVIPFQIGSNLFYFLLGIFALILLVLTVTSALMRFKLGPRWLFIHRFNYLVFWLIFLHGLNLGVDTQTTTARILFFSYAAVVGILTVRRILIYRV